MIESDNKTIWCGHLPEQVTEEILYELFLQAGPLERVRIARDRDGRPKNFAFITYCHDVSVPYAIKLFYGTTLFNRKLTLQSRGRMATLPPPIRCFGPDHNIEFSNQSAVAQKFADMTENLSQSKQFRDGQQYRDRQQFYEWQQLHDTQLGDAPQFRDFQQPCDFPQLHDEQSHRRSPSSTRRDEKNDKLVMASLQGNWSHRHHPYRSNEQPHNRDYRPRDSHSNHRSREKPSASWRDRRHHKKSNYHR